ncbi:hypothetical protein KJ596_04040, partial [Patescibacteria group bacterium]|nr:hypothetical protein [Patescibacteria group bacterium]MBU1868340.1 hypothetical protein [Patescibacteria group bacterium]
MSAKRRNDFTYKDIRKVVRLFSAQYRTNHNVPSLPGDQELREFRERLYQKFPNVISLVKKHLRKTSPQEGRGFDHLEEIAVMAGHLAEQECAFRKIDSPENMRIIDQAILAGLLHDLDRHLGFGEVHMIEGEKSARRILEKEDLVNETVLTVVRNHDHLGFDPNNDRLLEIIFAAVFDADHFRYGTERKSEYWEMREKKGIPPEEVIHDYQFVPPLRDAWRTNYGKRVGPPWIDFAIAI